jgi:hypothetical protein
MSYISHVAFSDESHHNIGRFRGVSMISLKSEHRELINNKLQSLLNSEGVTEFKWTRTRGIKERNVCFVSKRYNFKVAATWLPAKNKLVHDLN